VSERRAFDYVIVQVVPRVERDERLNVGVIVFCPTAGYLGARLVTDQPAQAQASEARWRALAPDLDVAAVRHQLDAIRAVVDGAADAGPIAALSISERFHWLSAPRSTVVQTSAGHAGVCDDPAATLQRVFTVAVG
jgi:hypothetical protein